MSTIEPDSGASAAEALDFFKTMKSILHTLGLYDFRDSFALLDYIKYAIAVCFWFATFLTSFHFVVLNSSDLQKTSTALFAANIMLISTIYFTMLFGQKSALRELLDRIEDVARTQITSRPVSMAIYRQAEAKITAVSLFIVNYCFVALPAYCIVLGMIPLISNLLSSQTMLIDMYPASVPFDRTTIAGFYALLTAQFIASAFYLALYTAALALHIGYTVYIQAFVFDIQAMLDGIDATAERKLRAIDLIDIVRLHDLATQLTQSFVSFQSYGLFLEVLTASLTIAIVLLQLESVTTNLNVEFYLSTNCLFIQSGILYTLALYSAKTTNSLLSVHVRAFHSHWFRYPVRVQKILIPIIRMSQKPIHFTCIKLVRCDLETFKKIINSSVSYYLLLRSV